MKFIREPEACQSVSPEFRQPGICQARNPDMIAQLVAAGRAFGLGLQLGPRDGGLGETRSISPPTELTPLPNGSSFVWARYRRNLHLRLVRDISCLRTQQRSLSNPREMLS